MGDVATLDPVLTRLRDEVRGVYGDRLERLVLFGSRARGDHRLDSDYDVAVFIREMTDLWTELGQLASVTAPYLLEDAFISAKPFATEQYWDKTSFMEAVRRDGVEL